MVVGGINFNTSDDDIYKIAMHLIQQSNASKQQVSKCRNEATHNIIDFLEKYYMDLEMEIDNCQGAMDGLDIAFEELNILKELVKYLGGDIDAHKQELVDKWFKDAREKAEVEKQENERKDAIIKRYEFPMVKTLKWKDTQEYNDIRDILVDMSIKVNEICDKMRK